MGAYVCVRVCVSEWVSEWVASSSFLGVARWKVEKGRRELPTLLFFAKKVLARKGHEKEEEEEQEEEQEKGENNLGKAYVGKGGPTIHNELWLFLTAPFTSQMKLFKIQQNLSKCQISIKTPEIYRSTQLPCM